MADWLAETAPNPMRKPETASPSRKRGHVTATSRGVPDGCKALKRKRQDQLRSCRELLVFIVKPSPIQRREAIIIFIILGCFPKPGPAVVPSFCSLDSFDTTTTCRTARHHFFCENGDPDAIFGAYSFDSGTIPSSGALFARQLT
jgi:hypothetical protein